MSLLPVLSTIQTQKFPSVPPPLKYSPWIRERAGLTDALPRGGARVAALRVLRPLEAVLVRDLHVVVERDARVTCIIPAVIRHVKQRQ